MWQCKKPLQSKSKSVEVTGLCLDVSQFPNSDERNKMVLTDNKRLSLKMILMKKVGTHTKSGRSIQVLNVPTWHLINKIKETGLTEHWKQPTRYCNNRKNIDFWGACLFARRWTRYPQFHQANRTSDIDQQIISSLLGPEKESSLLQTFKNSLDEFSML